MVTSPSSWRWWTSRFRHVDQRPRRVVVETLAQREARGLLQDVLAGLSVAQSAVPTLVSAWASASSSPISRASAMARSPTPSPRRSPSSWRIASASRRVVIGSWLSPQG
jgi:hypothetical protein